LNFGISVLLPVGCGRNPLTERGGFLPRVSC
jgi:hypothetical protein